MPGIRMWGRSRAGFTSAPMGRPTLTGWTGWDTGPPSQRPSARRRPGVELLAVRVFDRTLATNAAILARAIAWSVEQGVSFINLSLGTPNTDHLPVLQEAVEEAGRRGATIVSAARHNETDWYPGIASWCGGSGA